MCACVDVCVHVCRCSTYVVYIRTCAVEGSSYVFTVAMYVHLCVPFGVCRAHIFGFDREVDGFYHHKERAKVSNWC